MKAIYTWEGFLQGSSAQVARMLRSIGITEFVCMAYYERLEKKRDPGILIGCSLGGHSALLNAIPGDVVVCLDPRWQSPASYFDLLVPFQKPFKAPQGVKVYCFYRHGLMPGYPVEGGENVRLPWHVTHPGVPAYVAARVKSILEKEMK